MLSPIEDGRGCDGQAGGARSGNLNQAFFPCSGLKLNLGLTSLVEGEEGDGRGCDGEAGGVGGGSVAGPRRSGSKVVNRLSSCLSAMAVKFG